MIALTPRLNETLYQFSLTRPRYSVTFYLRNGQPSFRGQFDDRKEAWDYFHDAVARQEGSVFINDMHTREYTTIAFAIGDQITYL